MLARKTNVYSYVGASSDVDGRGHGALLAWALCMGALHGGTLSAKSPLFLFTAHSDHTFTAKSV